MEPIHFEGANTKLVATGCGDLPAYHGEGMFITRWKTNLRERLSILRHGTIWVSIIGEGHPPMAITGKQSAHFKKP